MVGKEEQRGYQSREHPVTKMSTINLEHLLTIFTFVHRKICRAYLQILRWIFVEDIRFFFTSSQKEGEALSEFATPTNKICRLWVENHHFLFESKVSSSFFTTFASQLNIKPAVMKLILMTRPEFFVEEHQILTVLFEEGLDTLHLRKPNTEPVYSERLISLIPEVYRRNIVVHDHFYLKNEYGLKGIHLNQRNPELPTNYKGHISCSCHTEEELKACSTFCDYEFLSPIFERVNDSEFSADFSSSKLHDFRKRHVINKKVMAMGNVGLDNLSLLKDYGFGGVVVLGDLWNRFDIHTHHDYKNIISHFRKLRKAVN